VRLAHAVSKAGIGGGCKASPLAESLRAEIARRGAVSFARFMALALYHEEFGYYRAGRRPGRGGDFVTSVSVGSAFGELLAIRFGRWLAGLPGSGTLRLVEAGAHDGRLALDILAWFSRCEPALWARLEYGIVEPAGDFERWQRETLAPFAEKVQWHRGWEAVPAAGVRGVIFANELLDAMPVHRLGWDAPRQRWFEWGVGSSDEGFRWVRPDPGWAPPGPSEGWLDPSELNRGWPFLPGGEESSAVLPDGFALELCPAAWGWWQAAARALGEGRLMTLDYGLEAAELFAPGRREGTLRAYSGHQAQPSVLDCPGEQDITAHVNFSALRRLGEAAGLETEEWTSQERFLGRALAWEEERSGAAAPRDAARLAQLRTLLHPDGFGRAFRVLVQRRGSPTAAA
jgi:SAM-dependent MidA family methyltransferase